ncbi:hypothetical protein [Streptomyces niveus]|uniref:hypothetical protein n=1 Tax=Streptomyces niveus TaxID=193462 RepID=UPI0003C61C79|nr:hypothetical protein [Streptomyces niveus]EST22805.1 hypothetical protein M877_28930 [Streptomyces niveus NCIMB 11891]
MDMQQVITLLTEISLIDDRVVKTVETEQIAQVRMWAAILREVPYEFAGEAIGEHYAESAWPVMPKDVAARWRKVARARLDRHTNTFEPTAHPHLDPDDHAGFRIALRAERDAVRTGCEAPVELRALMAGSAVPASAGQPSAEYLAARERVRAARVQSGDDERVTS